MAGENEELHALVMHYDGLSWSRAEPLSTYEWALNDIWGSSSSDVYAVGPTTVLHYDGTRWTKLPLSGGDRVWGTSPRDVFVLQAHAILHGTP